MAKTLEHRVYRRSESVIFRKTNERFGGLSNMAPGFPLKVNGVKILTSEALYQACRFPHRSDVQQLIIAQTSPMTAKMKSKPFRHDSRPDWDEVRVTVMRWCLRVKLAQNWDRFASLLRETGDRPIVEDSHKDDFWGAKPVDREILKGTNVLGRLLMELRAFATGPEADRYKVVEPPRVPQLLLLDNPVGVIGPPQTSAGQCGSALIASSEDVAEHESTNNGLAVSSTSVSVPEHLFDLQRVGAEEHQPPAHEPEASQSVTDPDLLPVGSDQELVAALQAISTFIGPKLGTRIADLERSVTGCSEAECRARGIDVGATSALLTAAHAVKRAAGQINVVIHAVGGILLIPQIMEPDERIEYVSLGAGNTGRDFDFETDRRVAEFKFIHWQGGAEAIRQNSLFKDFYCLAESKTTKRKELYVLGTAHPLRFLHGGRALSSVMSRNRKLWDEFRAKYGDRFSKVSQYYVERQHEVAIIDAAPLVPELARVVSAGESEEGQADLYR